MAAVSRMSNPERVVITAVLASYADHLAALPERVIIDAHTRTERRQQRIRAGHSPGAGVVVVGV